MKKGTEYELFVKNVYEKLNSLNLPNTKIEFHKVIKGTTNVKHEFDLYWEFQQSGITYKTVVECKGYTSSKVTKGDVAEFYAKMLDVGTGYSGIFATMSDYQDGALQFALSKGILPLIIKKPEKSDFDNSTILSLELNLIIQMPEIRNLKFSFNSDWMKNNNKTGKFHIDSNGDLLNLSNGTFNLTLNKFIILDPLKSKQETTFDDHVHILFGLNDDILISDLSSDFLFKAYSFEYDVYYHIITEKQTFNFLDFVEAIIVNKKNMEIDIVKNK